MAGQVNMFTKGIVSDMDPIFVDPQQWVFPTVNVRFMNKEGHGIVGMPLESNTHITAGVPDGTAGEEYLIRPGYVLVGACEYNGIAYLLCTNLTTGAGEVGTFPSPRAITTFDINTGAVTINQSLTGFDRVYRPLVNYTGLATNYNPASRSAFNSILFNFTKRVDIFARPDYDDSVNLYLADSINPNRHINSGFDQTGQLLIDRLYCINDFGSKMNLMPTTNLNIDIDDFWIETYGELLHGNYTFFFQYATRNFDKTEMCTQCGPIQIDDSGSVCRNSFGGKAIESSNKKVRFQLSNLDQSYSFIRVGYTRYFSDANNKIQREYIIVEKYFEINNNVIQFSITGNEANYPISAEEFLLVFPDERKCKSHDVSDDRYMGGNWEAEEYNYELLNQFFSLVELKWEDGNDPGAPAAHPENRIYGGTINPSDLKNKSQNRDAKITYSQTGYFRGEAYPFACIVELPNGSYSQAFLPKGIDSFDLDRNEVEDEYNGVTFLGRVNNKGFLRFPATTKSNPYIGCRYIGPVEINNTSLYLLSVRYDFTKAITWLNAQPAVTQSLFHSVVRRIHFVRGDRFVNLRYQGLMVAACRARGNEYEAKYTELCSLPAVNSYTHSSYYSSFIRWQGYVYGTADNPGFSAYTSGYHVGGVGIGQSVPDYGSVINDIFNQQSGIYGSDLNYNWMYRDVYAPIFRAYTPMQFWIKAKAGNVNNEKSREVNYASRFFCMPNHYGLFSPDFMANQNNDLAGIKHMYRTAKTMNATRNLPGDPDSLIFKSNTNHLRDGWSPIWDNGEKLVYPRAYGFDAEAYFYTDGMLDVQPTPELTEQAFRRQWDDFSMVKVGESANIAPQDALTLAKKFINYSSDFFRDRDNCMFYAEKVDGRDRSFSCRSFYMPKYIGIHTTLDSYDKAWTGNYNLDIINLCNQDPKTIYLPDIADPLAIPYSIIGTPRSYSEIETEALDSIYIFSGDCFLQRVYFKQIFWDGSAFGSSDEHENWDEVGFNDDAYDNAEDNGKKQSYFTHGIILSAVFECAHNINMRVPGELTTFYPKTEKYEFVRRPYNEEGVESWQTNNGYDQILSDRKFFVYDEVAPKDIIKFPQRIRHSEQATNGSFEDALRQIKLSYYKDFESSAGPIVSVRDFNGTLFSVQEKAINRHFTNQEQIKTTTTTGDLILGIGSILSQQCQKLSDYGSYDQFSVIKGQRGIYGIDSLRKILWRASIASTSTGTLTGTVQNLSSEKMNERQLNEILKLFSDFSDINSRHSDTPITGIGIHSGYDQKYNEVLFTFMHNNTGTNRDPIGRTLVFSEKLDEFTGEYRFYPALWHSISNDLFSSLSNQSLLKSMVFRHNQEDSCLMFYGQQDEMELSIMINGASAEGAGPVIEKEFLAYNIDSLQHEFSAIRYETEFQISDKIPFRENTRFWANPEYLEHTWQCPVFVKTDATNQAFQPNSSMRGKWMKLTLFYRQNIPTFVKTIASFFNSSHS